MTVVASLAIAAACVVVAPRLAIAHKGSDSYLTVRAEGADLDVRWDIALRDLDAAIGLDGDGDRALTWAELRARHSAIADHAMGRLALRADGATCAPGAVEHRLARHTDGAYAVLQFIARCPEAPRSIAVDYALLFDLDPQHRGLLHLEHAGRTQVAILRSDARVARSGADGASWWSALVDFVGEGVWHIWIGLDHILFLLALLLPVPLRRRGRSWEPHDRLRPVLLEVTAIVTAFTIAHSITLAAAALGWVSLPSRLVETAIAITVVLAALNNVFPVVTGRWGLAFGLGLLHGFGFAGVLAELGLPTQHLALALIGFNLGVELGQLAIVAAFVPLAFALRRHAIYRPVVLVAGSLAIAALAVMWAFERAAS